jgi:hypothetical protein
MIRKYRTAGVENVLWFTYGLHAVYIRFTYGLHTVYMRFTYGLHTVQGGRCNWREHIQQLDKDSYRNFGLLYHPAGRRELGRLRQRWKLRRKMSEDEEV